MKVKFFQSKTVEMKIVKYMVKSSLIHVNKYTINNNNKYTEFC